MRRFGWSSTNAVDHAGGGLLDANDLGILGGVLREKTGRGRERGRRRTGGGRVDRYFFLVAACTALATVLSPSASVVWTSVALVQAAM